MQRNLEGHLETTHLGPGRFSAYMEGELNQMKLMQPGGP